MTPMSYLPYPPNSENMLLFLNISQHWQLGQSWWQSTAVWSMQSLVEPLLLPALGFSNLSSDMYSDRLNAQSITLWSGLVLLTDGNCHGKLALPSGMMPALPSGMIPTLPQLGEGSLASSRCKEKFDSLFLTIWSTARRLVRTARM